MIYREGDMIQEREINFAVAHLLQRHELIIVVCLRRRAHRGLLLLL
jgi:hypothetical protein